MADFIVLRPAADAPAGFLPAALNGRWFDTTTASAEDRLRSVGLLFAKAVPTDEVEERGDGKVAQVWEISPNDA